MDFWDVLSPFLGGLFLAAILLTYAGQWWMWPGYLVLTIPVRTVEVPAVPLPDCLRGPGRITRGEAVFRWSSDHATLWLRAAGSNGMVVKVSVDGNAVRQMQMRAPALMMLLGVLFPLGFSFWAAQADPTFRLPVAVIAPLIVVAILVIRMRWHSTRMFKLAEITLLLTPQP